MKFSQIIYLGMIAMVVMFSCSKDIGTEEIRTEQESQLTFQLDGSPFEGQENKLVFDAHLRSPSGLDIKIGIYVFKGANGYQFKKGDPLNSLLFAQNISNIDATSLTINESNYITEAVVSQTRARRVLLDRLYDDAGYECGYHDFDLNANDFKFRQVSAIAPDFTGHVAQLYFRGIVVRMDQDEEFELTINNVREASVGLIK